MNAGSAPVAFIGLDGAEPSLLRRWMADGTLPVLADLARSGTCVDVDTLPGMGDGATWPTLITGVGPARHGRYFRRQIRTGSHARYRFDIDRDLGYPPFWQPVSDAGRRVAILDLPYAPAAARPNGVYLTDWLIHARYGRVRGWPDAFVRSVLSELGDDPVAGNSDRYRRSPECMGHLLEALIRRVHMKTSLIQRVASEGRYDLLATSFTELHDAGHIMWHLHDPTHPEHDRAWREAHGDPLERLYVELDRAIGRILEHAHASASIALFAGLGMGPNYTANNMMERLVRRLCGQRDAGPDLRERLGSLGAPAAAVRFGGRLDRAFRILSEQNSRFFALPHNESSGAIRINLQGREPRGRVPPAEFDRTCAEIADAFAELVNPDTGQRVVERVVAVSDDNVGERRNDLPDLLVVWSRKAPFSSIYSARTGRIDGVGSWGRTGDHTSNAMFLLRGSSGRIAMRSHPRPRIADIGPTIAGLLGVSMTGVEGAPLCEQ